MNNRHMILAAFSLAAMTDSDRVEAWATGNELDLCAKALTQQLSLAQVTPLDYRIDQESSSNGRARRQGGVWHLDARHPETNEVVARIDCVVDAREKEMRLTEVPLSANDAHIRATID
jgi:hypothetical protein